jgi:hypothetical protein
VCDVDTVRSALSASIIIPRHAPTHTNFGIYQLPIVFCECRGDVNLSARRKYLSVFLRECRVGGYGKEFREKKFG